MHEKKNHKSTIIALTTSKGDISNSGFNSIMMVKDRCPTIKHCETCTKFIITADWQPGKKKNHRRKIIVTVKYSRKCTFESHRGWFLSFISKIEAHPWCSFLKSYDENLSEIRNQLVSCFLKDHCNWLLSHCSAKVCDFFSNATNPKRGKEKENHFGC